MPDSSKSPTFPLLLVLALLACAAGLAGVVLAASIAFFGHDHVEQEPATIRLTSPEERMKEPGMAARGAAVFEAQACTACHGKFLEGGVGPCLTDAVWLKGSSFAEIRKSINEGSSEKGMPPFDKMLSEDDKIALVAFIKSRAQGLRGVKYALYEGRWQKLPEFSKLKPIDIGPLKDDEAISLAKFERQANYGVVFAGTLLVPVGGDYGFQLAADDGSQLLIDGQMAMNHDGIHKSKERKSATLPLKAGPHAFELRYFQGGGEQALRLTWSGPVSEGFLTEAVATPAQLLVKDKVRVVRGNLAGQTGSRMLAIGLPGNVSLAFDTGSFALPFAWHGDFLDVGGSRQGRGEHANLPMGNKTVAKSAKPLVHAGDEKPAFLGYRVAGRKLVVEGRLQGTRFDLTLESAARGATVTVAFRDPPPTSAVAEDAAGAHPIGAAPQVLHFSF